jgi:hypothetical protein
MSNLPTLKEAQSLAQAIKNQELQQKNKKAAEHALLRIQLMLARKTK